VTLRIRILRDRGARVDLAEFIRVEPVELVSMSRSGELTLAVSSTEGDRGGSMRRTVTRYVDDAGTWRALDETIFEVDANTFAEVSQRQQAAGPNLHVQPIRLPRVMTAGEWVQPLAGVPARVALSAYALVRLESEDNTTSVDVVAIGLLGVERGERALQWSALSIGEVCNGPPRGEPERWLVGACVGGKAFFRAIPAGLLERARTPLGDNSPAVPRSSVF